MSAMSASTLLPYELIKFPLQFCCYFQGCTRKQHASGRGSPPCQPSQLLRLHSLRSADIQNTPSNLCGESGLLGIDRIRVLLGSFWREILRGRRHSSSQDTSAMGIPFPDVGAFFSKLKLYSVIPKPE